MKSKLNLECLSERITPSAGVDNPGVEGYSVPNPPSQSGPPSGMFPTPQEALDYNNKLIDEANALSDKASDLMLEIAVLDFKMSSAKKNSVNPNLTPAERATAVKELAALEKQRGDLVQSLYDVVSEYNGIINALKKYNRFPRYDNEPKELLTLPDGYEKYAPPIDPRMIV